MIGQSVQSGNTVAIVRDDVGQSFRVLSPVTGIVNERGQPIGGLYGTAIATMGMFASGVYVLSMSGFGPIADNAGGIAEMSQLPPEVRERTDNLDAVGNTTAATGKGFAIASAALTSLALFAAFVGIAGIDAIDIYKAPVF